MWKEMKDMAISLKKINNCLKLHSSFECWVNEPHPRSQVHQSAKALGILINLKNAFQEMRVGDGTYPESMPMIKCHTIY
jgi:hypothetical protein